MRILITGVTGFLGKTLLPLLIENFPLAEILCCVRNIKKVDENILLNPRVKISIDIDDLIIQQFNPEFVIHLAAYNTSNEEKDDIEALIESNIRYGLHLLNALRKVTSLKLFINTGSFSQYTSHGDAYLYSASKSAFEVFLKYYSRIYNWKYITVVPYSVYGGLKTVKRILDYVIESVDAIDPVNMSPGEQKLDFIHVYDVANFYVSAIKKYDDLANRTVFHIGTGKVTSIRQLAELVESTLCRRCNINWGGRDYRSNDIMYACALPQPERDRIWTPKYNLSTGLKVYLHI